MSLSLKRKSARITRSSRGIRRAIAERLAAEGAAEEVRRSGFADMDMVSTQEAPKTRLGWFYWKALKANGSNGFTTKG
jgi:hypothetical protein